MTNLLRSSSTIPSISHPLLRASATASEAVFTPLDDVIIGQTILKFTGALSTLKQLQPPGTVPKSPAIAAAWHKLVKTIIQLKSPNSGWSINQPQTPEALTPYVLEEAQDVLEALHSSSGKVDQKRQQSGAIAAGDSSVCPDLTAVQKQNIVIPQSPLLWTDYVWLKNLSPWLLWAIARSAHSVMRLMEGTSAKVLQSGQESGQIWQSGILRLAVLLEVKVPEASFSLDLATYQASPAVLLPASLIQLNESVLCQQPTAVAELTQRLIAQIQTTTPAVCPFIEGVPAEILVPSQNWQSSLLKLHIGFEFMPQRSLDQGLDQSLNQSLNQGLHLDIANYDSIEWDINSPRSIPKNLEIKFTDPVWLEQYADTVIQQQLASFAPSLLSLYPLECNSSEQAHPPVNLIALEPDSLTLLINDACTAADNLQRSLPLISRNGFQKALMLDDLLLRLLWCLGHSAYEVMQLMSGVRVHLLQPGYGWVSGTLRFLVSLKVQTPDLEWHLDIMTGQPLTSGLLVPASDAIAYSDESQWCQQPSLLADLETKVWQQIGQATPEIRLLMAGAEIDFAEINFIEKNFSQERLNDFSPEISQGHQWQPGILQLSAVFEFIPDIAALND